MKFVAYSAKYLNPSNGLLFVVKNLDVTKLVMSGFKNTYRKKGIGFLAVFGITVGISLQATLIIDNFGTLTQYNDLFNGIVGGEDVTDSHNINDQLYIPFPFKSELENKELSNTIDDIPFEIDLPGTFVTRYEHEKEIMMSSSDTTGSTAIPIVDFSRIPNR